MLSFEKKIIKYNYSSRNNQEIEYIVIHDTGNPRAGADAYAHYQYFSGGNRGASAHYFVDDQTIIQTIEDANASWHCGDGKGKYGITNKNSIGVEICVNADGDYEKAVNNAIVLTSYLMKKHNLSLDRVVRHYDASRKICPKSMSENNWARWNSFKESLKIDELVRALDVLQEQGLINSPEYWLKHARDGETVNGEYAAILIKRMGDLILSKQF